MYYFIYIVLLVVFCYGLTKLKFVTSTGISSKTIIAFFLLKAFVGLAFGYISLRFFGNESDCWDFNRQGWDEYHLLFNDPKTYFTNIFTGDIYGHYHGVLSSSNSFWNDLKTNIILKILSITNFVARGNYYINSLFFCFVAYLGHIALYKLFIKIYPSKKTLVLLTSFLLPSTLYFTAAVSKDTISFFCMCVLIYCCYQFFYGSFKGIKQIVSTLLLLVVFFLLKSHYVLLAMPAFIAIYIATKFKAKIWLSFTLTYLVCLTIFFGINKIIPSINPPNAIAQRQADFFSLTNAKADIAMDTLQPTLKSFASTLPQAINHSLLRPYLTETKNKTLLPAAIELLCYQLLFILFIFLNYKNGKSKQHPFLWFLLFFALSSIILTGYITPNLNAIFRYRSLFWPLLLIPMVCSVNSKWLERINRLNIFSM